MLIPVADPAPPLPATDIAKSTIVRLNREFDRRVQTHKESYLAFWNDFKATPDDILANMGSGAIIWLAAAQESVRHLNNLAQIIGKNLSDFLPAEYFQPRREFIVDENYNVTIAPPASGYNAWGYPIEEPIVYPVEEPTPG